MKPVIYTHRPQPLIFSLLFFSVHLLLSFYLKAQTREHVQHEHAWVMYFGSHKISNRIGLHLEAQWRRSDWVMTPQQLLLRPGINFHLHEQVLLSAGYGYIWTSVYGKLPSRSAFPENRLWEQVQLKQKIACLEWISRYRLEQRFSNLPSYNYAENIYEPGDAVYTGRVRILNRLSIPLNGSEITDKCFYLSVYDEVFINFGKKVAQNLFDQNRVYLALGYKIPNWGRLEAGFMEQTLIKANGIQIENNHTLQLGLISNIEFRKKR